MSSSSLFPQALPQVLPSNRARSSSLSAGSTNRKTTPASLKKTVSLHNVSSPGTAASNPKLRVAFQNAAGNGPGGGGGSNSKKARAYHIVQVNGVHYRVTQSENGVSIGHTKDHWKIIAQQVVEPLVRDALQVNPKISRISYHEDGTLKLSENPGDTPVIIDPRNPPLPYAGTQMMTTLRTVNLAYQNLVKNVVIPYPISSSQSNNPPKKTSKLKKNQTSVNPPQQPPVNPAQQPLVNPPQQPPVNPAQQPLVNAAQQPLVNAAQQPLVKSAQQSPVSSAQQSPVSSVQFPPTI